MGSWRTGGAGAHFQRMHSVKPQFPAPILVLAPHPDDETAGAGGLIARGTASGAAVFLLFLTDGAPRNRRFFARGFRGSRAEYRGVRRQEALAATAMLGVPACRLIFCSIPDLELSRYRRTAAAHLTAAMAAVRPRTLLAPAGENGHPDHDAAHQVAHWALTARRARLGDCEAWEYPLYAWHRGRIRYGWLPAGPGMVSWQMDRPEREAKAAALAAYASQRETLAAFPIGRECLRPLRRRQPRRRAVWREWGWEIAGAGSGEGQAGAGLSPAAWSGAGSNAAAPRDPRG